MEHGTDAMNQGRCTMPDLYELIEDQEMRAKVLSYGIDPTAVEEYLAERPLHYRDDTADLAIARADRELARRRRAAR